MALSLKDLHARVSLAIAKGTRYDNAIPSYVKDAAKWLEDNYNFKYMEQIDSTSFIPTTTSGRTFAQPARLKSVILWRYIIETTTVSGEGRWKKITKVAPGDLGGIVTRPPRTYYMKGRTSLILGEIPDQDYTQAELQYRQYSSWPTSVTTTAALAVTNVQAATAATLSITFTSLSTTTLATVTLSLSATAVSGATGTLLAASIQSALQAADAAATNLTCTWASNVLTISDASGRAISDIALLTAGGAEVDTSQTITTPPWLVSDAENLLIAQTIIEMSPFLQDQGLAALYTSKRDEALRVITLSEEDLEASSEDNVMQYGDYQYGDEFFVDPLGENQ